MPNIESGAYWLRVPYLDSNGETNVFQERYYLEDTDDLNQIKQEIKTNIEFYGGKVLGEISIRPYKGDNQC